MDVVLADDSDVSRRMLAATLERCGHRVTAVADGEAAWMAFEQSRPPMLILDWQMPGMDGLEVCRRVRSSAGGVDVFVLMVTGRDTSTNLADALEAGVDDYVTKPVAPPHLEARLRIAERRIEQTLARRSAEDALATAQWLAGIGQTALALQHEINNPLMALLTGAQLLADDAAAPQSYRQQAGSMLEQTRRIAAVVKRLRELKQPRSVEYVGNARMIDLSGKTGQR